MGAQPQNQQCTAMIPSPATIHGPKQTRKDSALTRALHGHMRSPILTPLETDFTGFGIPYGMKIVREGVDANNKATKRIYPSTRMSSICMSVFPKTLSKALHSQS